MTIVVYGDSFACDGAGTWPDLLRRHGSVINRSQAGSSEYRIWSEIQRQGFDEQDQVIVCHTSPYRVYVDQRLFDYNSQQHAHCDLIYSDIKHKHGQEAEHIAWWFENVYDLGWADLSHDLLIQHIQRSLPPHTIHISFFDLTQPNLHNLHQLWRDHSGDSINHLTALGNQKVYQFLSARL